MPNKYIGGKSIPDKTFKFKVQLLAYMFYLFIYLILQCRDIK